MDLNSEHIVARLKSRLENYDWDEDATDSGIVYSVGDGIAFVKV